jgi:hypothetical protein
MPETFGIFETGISLEQKRDWNNGLLDQGYGLWSLYGCSGEGRAGSAILQDIVQVEKQGLAGTLFMDDKSGGRG